MQLKSSHNDIAGNTKKLCISYLGNSQSVELPLKDDLFGFLVYDAARGWVKEA